MGKLFTTGWERKPRGNDANLLPEPAKPNVDSRTGDESLGLETMFTTQTLHKEKETKTVFTDGPPTPPAAEAGGTLDAVTGKEIGI